jgi:hypothetical protein
MALWVFPSISAAIFQTLRFILHNFEVIRALEWLGQPFLGLYIQLQSCWFWAFSLVNAALVKAVG